VKANDEQTHRGDDMVMNEFGQWENEFEKDEVEAKALERLAEEESLFEDALYNAFDRDSTRQEKERITVHGLYLPEARHGIFMGKFKHNTEFMLQEFMRVVLKYNPEILEIVEESMKKYREYDRDAHLIADEEERRGLYAYA
jgi:hypothetical protein